MPTSILHFKRCWSQAGLLYYGCSTPQVPPDYVVEVGERFRTEAATFLRLLPRQCAESAPMAAEVVRVARLAAHRVCASFLRLLGG